MTKKMEIHCKVYDAGGSLAIYEYSDKIWLVKNASVIRKAPIDRPADYKNIEKLKKGLLSIYYKDGSIETFN